MTAEEKDPTPRDSVVSFSVDETPNTSHDKNSISKRRLSARSSFRSSFFRLKGLVFKRSGGETGADINALRGSHGPEFEGNATIKRGGGTVVSCGCFGDAEKEKIVLIKGTYCFVFVKENDESPQYAISLAHTKAKIHSQSHGVHHVTIETSLGDVDWELGFQQKQTAEKFVDAFLQQAAVGEADEARKRLGHDKLVKKKKSVLYAESVARKKLEDQPEKKENVLLEDVNRVDPSTFY